MPPPGRPLVVFDGDCGFCRRWIGRWRQITGDRVDYLPFQEVAGRFPTIPAEAFAAAVHLLLPDGAVHRGADAVVRLLALGGHRAPAWACAHLPGMAAVAEAGYRFVASHRPLFSRLTRWLWGDRVERPTHFLTRWLFLRAIAVTFLIAFASIGVQVEGLVGSHGVMPAERLLTVASERLGADRYLQIPTLYWLAPSDATLAALCWGGAAMSLLALLGVAVGPFLFGCWVAYLSLVSIGGGFLDFQWDSLLLEVGLLAACFAPARVFPSLARERAPSPLFLWLLRFLLFRLIFSSGWVKLASGDAAWRSLSALEVHYQTQPLPTWVGWYLHQLSAPWQRASCIGMFVIELAVPFLIFLPRRVRHAAAAPFVGLQLLIFLTGNYGFFNLLTLALCLTMLDDALLARLLPRWLTGGVPAVPLPRRASRLALAPVGALLFLLAALQLGGMLRGRALLPPPARACLAAAAPFRSVNHYGLFAVMTTTRSEIVLEGTRDGTTWEAYGFRWKPGDVARPPALVAPHMPRLDWQMWFAALGDYRGQAWLRNLEVRLLEGEPRTLALLGDNPFGSTPPLAVRAQLYDYRFSTRAERQSTGAWWVREDRGPYSPALRRRG